METGTVEGNGPEGVCTTSGHVQVSLLLPTCQVRVPQPWAHPHFVVDQVKDGIVGDPLQGQAGQPLLQHLQQLPDRRPPGEQLSEKGPSLRNWPRKVLHTEDRTCACPTRTVGNVSNQPTALTQNWGGGLSRNYSSSETQRGPEVQAGGSGQPLPPAHLLSSTSQPLQNALHNDLLYAMFVVKGSVLPPPDN